VEQPDQHTEQGENLAIMDAIDDLIAEMSRVEPELIHEDACEAISKTVHGLLRNAGKVA
jgi:hypothetical protein